VIDGRAGAWRTIRLDQRGRRVRLPADVRLDLAGVAKGWTADQVAALLEPAGPCLVDAGGDLVAVGAPAGMRGWPIGVADPRRPDADLALVLLRDAGIATSGVDFRCWTHQGRPRHHLIDPRTGMPPGPSWRTVSVAAGSCLDANTVTTAAIVRGYRAVPWLRSIGLPARLVHEDGRVVALGGWPLEEGVA
jgi:thiamine biosynthesis lipoprotein